MKLHFTVVAAMLLLTGAVVAQPPSLEQMWEMVQAQQAQIKALQAALEQAQSQIKTADEKLVATETKLSETDAKVEATAEVLEESPSGETNTTAQSSWTERTQVGGYAELHYNNLEDDATLADGGKDDLNEVDVHRFVIYLSHQFNDRMRFFSELEVEHALVRDTATGSGGEIELEQAWVEMDLNPRHRIRAGVDVLPIGILNQTHEPNTFFGVERNPVETEIIPATWWESGVAAIGELDHGFSYDAYVHSGLRAPSAGGGRFRPRDGRLKVSQARDQDVAFTGRLKYTGIPGLELATSLQYQRDYTGSSDRAEADALLFETHLDWRHVSGLGLRALYAHWDLEQDLSNGLNPDALEADVLQGWYVEPSYRFDLPVAVLGEMGVFARYNEWDERNQLAGNAFRYVRMNRANLGLNYWPHPNLVFKFDAQWDGAAGATDRELDGFNLGLGLQF